MSFFLIVVEIGFFVAAVHRFQLFPLGLNMYETKATIHFYC